MSSANSTSSGATSAPPEPHQESTRILDDPGALINLVLPWAISLVFHTMLFLLMFLVVWVVQVTRTELPLPLSDAVLSDYLDEPRSADGRLAEMEVQQPVLPTTADRTAQQPLDLLSETAQAGRNHISIIGIGAGAGSGELAKYGLSAAGLGEGPSFFGLGKGEKHARRICYVVDRSGSMVDEIDFVKDEVIRSIDRLHRIQEFHIIFFSSGEPLEAPPRKFVHAIKDYKKQAFDFVSTIDAGGSTNPIQAMTRAIRLGADLIYFLTDGEFDPQLVEVLRKNNRQKKVRIYTIAFVRRNGEDLLRQIARENGGEFRFVSEDELY